MTKPTIVAIQDHLDKATYEASTLKEAKFHVRQANQLLLQLDKER